MGIDERNLTWWHDRLRDRLRREVAADEVLEFRDDVAAYLGGAPTQMSLLEAVIESVLRKRAEADRGFR